VRLPTAALLLLLGHVDLEQLGATVFLDGHLAPLAGDHLQRFGSSLNPSDQFRALVLDGVNTAESPLARPVFNAAVDFEDAGVAAAVERIHLLVLRLLRRRGYRLVALKRMLSALDSA